MLLLRPFALEEKGQEMRRLSCVDLTQCKRVQDQIDGAAGEALGDVAVQQQIGGAGEHEPLSASTAIDGSLDGQEGLRDPLHLVDDHPVGSRPKLLGLLAGLFEATANVAVPPLIIYLMLLGVAPLATVQTLNLCFSVGKAVQVGTWAVYGDVAPAFWLAAAALTVPAVVTLFAGMRLRERIDAPTYRKWLRGALSLMAMLLFGQYAYLQLLAR